MKAEKFYADSMLGKLTRWLRLMGFSVEYATSDLSDDEIISHCTKNHLFLLTRDRELSLRYRESFYMESDIYLEQLKDFTAVFRPDPELYFTLCPICNGSLIKTKIEDYTGNLPTGVRLLQKRVFVCKDCGKVYWEGSHFDAILKKINEITKGSLS